MDPICTIMTIVQYVLLAGLAAILATLGWLLGPRRIRIRQRPMRVVDPPAKPAIAARIVQLPVRRPADGQHPEEIGVTREVKV